MAGDLRPQVHGACSLENISFPWRPLVVYLVLPYKSAKKANFNLEFKLRYNLIRKLNQFKTSRDLLRQAKMWVNGIDHALDLYGEIERSVIAFRIQSFLSK